jgi:hypothetical protein
MIERTVKVFCRDNNVPHGPNAELHVLAGKAADHLASVGIAQTLLKPLRRVAGDRHGPVSPETLGAYVHGGLIPTQAELNRAWDEIEGSLKLMLDRLK